MSTIVYYIVVYAKMVRPISGHAVSGISFSHLLTHPSFSHSYRGFIMHKNENEPDLTERRIGIGASPPIYW
jgi:hypothetical protein